MMSLRLVTKNDVALFLRARCAHCQGVLRKLLCIVKKSPAAADCLVSLLTSCQVAPRPKMIRSGADTLLRLFFVIFQAPLGGARGVGDRPSPTYLFVKPRACTRKIPAGTGQGSVKAFVCVCTCAQVAFEVSLVSPQLKSSTRCQICTRPARDAPCQVPARARWSEDPNDVTVWKGGCGCWGGGTWVAMLPGEQARTCTSLCLCCGFLSLAAPVFLKAGRSHMLP